MSKYAGSKMDLRAKESAEENGDMIFVPPAHCGKAA